MFVEPVKSKKYFAHYLTWAKQLDSPTATVAVAL